MRQFYNFKKSIYTVLFVLLSFSSYAQVDMVASVDVTPPVTNGQTFNYTLETVSTGTVYNGVRVLITYNPSIIQVNSFTPSGAFNLTIISDASVSGEIRYEATKTAGNFNDTQLVFTVEFEVIDSGQNIVIVNDTNPSDGSVVAGPSGDVTGTTNDIDFSTLSINNSEFKNSLSIYPNPVKNKLYIKAKGELSFNIQSIKIHSIDGKLVRNERDIETRQGEISVDISNLKSALYFMTVVSEDDKQATYKIMVK